MVLCPAYRLRMLRTVLSFSPRRRASADAPSNGSAVLRTSTADRLASRAFPEVARGMATGRTREREGWMVPGYL